MELRWALPPLVYTLAPPHTYQPPTPHPQGLCINEFPGLDFEPDASGRGMTNGDQVGAGLWCLLSARERGGGVYCKPRGMGWW